MIFFNMKIHFISYTDFPPSPYGKLVSTNSSPYSEETRARGPGDGVGNLFFRQFLHYFRSIFFHRNGQTGGPKWPRDGEVSRLNIYILICFLD